MGLIRVKAGYGVRQVRTSHGNKKPLLAKKSCGGEESRCEVQGFMLEQIANAQSIRSFFKKRQA